MEFHDGVIKSYAVDTMSENMYTKIDADGYSQKNIDLILNTPRTNKQFLSMKYI